MTFFVDPKLTFTAVASLLALIVAAVTLSNLSATSTDTVASDLLTDENDILPPLFPLEIRDYIGFLVAILGLMMAAGGGIGGGGILVPVYTLILQFPVKHAIALASVTVFGGATANLMLNLPKQHPDHPHRSCIDWDLILQMEPMTMAGALAGASLNDILPDIVIVVLLLLLLTLTAYGTLRKAVAIYNQETIQSKDRSVIAEEEEDNLVLSSRIGNDYGAVLLLEDDSESSNRPVLAAPDSPSGELDVKHQSWIDALKLSVLFVVITSLNIWKGGLEKDNGSAEQNERSIFWVAQGSILLVIALFSLWVRKGLLYRIKSGGPVVSDIHWDEKNTIWYPVMAVVAGLVAGMFGIGGGIVKGPLMLALGVHPMVASATSACMILYTSSTATISYGIFGILVFDYAVACLLVGFVATLVGQTAMALVMQRYQRHSYIAFSIGIVVAVSAVCMAMESIIAMLELEE